MCSQLLTSSNCRILSSWSSQIRYWSDPWYLDLGKKSSKLFLGSCCLKFLWLKIIATIHCRFKHERLPFMARMKRKLMWIQRKGNWFVAKRVLASFSTSRPTKIRGKVGWVLEKLKVCRQRSQIPFQHSKVALLSSVPKSSGIFFCPKVPFLMLQGSKPLGCH